MPLTSGRGDAAPPFGDDVEARARRLGITIDRVLEEYRRIGFSDISRILSWDDGGMLTAKASEDLSAEDAPAIAEIVASAGTGKIYRVKLHDKKPVLDALLRYFGLLKQASDVEPGASAAVDPREAIIRELDRIAAEDAARSGDRTAEA